MLEGLGDIFYLRYLFDFLTWQESKRREDGENIRREYKERKLEDKRKDRLDSYWLFR